MRLPVTFANHSTCRKLDAGEIKYRPSECRILRAYNAKLDEQLPHILERRTKRFGFWSYS
ncbi:hypothetical protein RMSM_01202 [Rhodopirellula maiorica SM1]|uniref:Uncharacterized protein n=1 Tax=Rhodopirellula maiorica SM1 TaxID=1265738 RepID=M5RRB3_9BACT|nr:hypothetical protein RMSM_01202 [Rhodopirellula maiorica SM1]